MTPDTLHIKPAAGVTVRDPVTGRALAGRGETKRRSIYWLRRLRDGDVVETSPANAAKLSSKASSKTTGGQP